jgi:hypothetical protein
MAASRLSQAVAFLCAQLAAILPGSYVGEDAENSVANLVRLFKMISLKGR